MAIRFDITFDHDMYIGVDQTITIDVLQADESTAQTMTGWALTWEVKASRGAAASISKTTSAGISIGNGNGTDDRATITIADTDTEALEPGTYYHQLRRTDAGSERILTTGDFVLQETGL